MNHKTNWSFLVLISVVILAGCATGEEDKQFGSEPPEDPLTDAHPASYGADSFTFRKKQNRRPRNDSHFYFKQCELSGDQSFYSKTSYWCTYP